MPPLALTDDQMLIIQQAAAPLQPQDRGQFLQRVAFLLRDVEIGDGAVGRAVRQAQAETLKARPVFTGLAGQPKLRTG
jgi:hypothetical protein